MKKTRNTTTVELGTVVVYADDVAALAAMLADAAATGGEDSGRALVVTAGDYELGIDELADLPRDPDQIEIRTNSAALRLALGYRSSISGPDTIATRGLGAQVNEYLDARCRPPLHWLGRLGFWASAPITVAAVAVAYPVALGAQWLIGPSVSQPVLWTSMVAFMFVGTRVHDGATTSRLFRTKRPPPSRFWANNWEKIAVGVIIAALVSVPSFLLGLARGQQSAASVAASPPGTTDAGTVDAGE